MLFAAELLHSAGKVGQNSLRRASFGFSPVALRMEWHDFRVADGPLPFDPLPGPIDDCLHGVFAHVQLVGQFLAIL